MEIALDQEKIDENGRSQLSTSQARSIVNRLEYIFASLVPLNVIL